MLCLIALSLFLSSQTLTAEASTKGSVGMTANPYADTAVDPKDNDEILTERDATEGPYSLSYVSDFNFGKHAIPKGEAQYFALNDTVTMKADQTEKQVANFIQIADTSGSENGWKLFVSSNDLPDSNGNTLEGMVYNFHTITLKPIVADQNAFQHPQALWVPETPVKVVGASQQQTLIAEAKGLEGQGRWHVLFGPTAGDGADSISMTLPKGAVKQAGNYRSTLTWDFSNAE